MYNINIVGEVIMKKILALAIVLSFASSAIAAEATYTKSFVDKISAPLSQKEIQLKNKKSDYEKAQKERKAAYEKAQKERKEAYEKAQKQRQAENQKKKEAQQRVIEKKKQAMKDLMN